jgi:uncharacterized membrane protein
MKFTDEQKRSIAKVITWRVILTVVNTFIGYWASGSWTIGLGAAGIALVVNSFIYWAHERVWNSVQWGKTVTETSTEPDQAH